MTMSEEKKLSMEEEALKRKERLKALKRTVNKQDSEVPSTTDSSNESNKKAKFRSYTPQDEAIKENAIIATAEAVDLEAEVHTQLELLRTPIVIEEIDIANLAPRKPDWDLKRDVSKKLEKLELRTQRSIAELIRVRLRSAEPTNMLMEGVNLAGSAVSSTSKLIRSTDDGEEASAVET